MIIVEDLNKDPRATSECMHCRLLHTVQVYFDQCGEREAGKTVYSLTEAIAGLGEALASVVRLAPENRRSEALMFAHALVDAAFNAQERGEDDYEVVVPKPQ
ncbi:hypothetical protein PQJ75_00830 [Rhodoplanes sp. TEM]|uniref:Uncharacterized protein n=1 Tax=Rhodoplanes tepidamans TaxID=200616 RepID=A0ABT5J589_RHOTP|nr:MULTISPECIES: hypothetical protein [Rhodoplanes]MDC7784797.1 hypothetical protein [Rhodoplanes tepidamans]MDC7982264.1 hypothetical protein [Rhodoplanes sp. TEM]MDQ0356271.1 hypothetical protein [Rhodoplanes tepidamans]